MKLSSINNSSQLCLAVQASQYVPKEKRRESNESRKLWKKKHTSCLYLMTFFAFGNVTMHLVSMFWQDQRREGWKSGALVGRVKNNFVRGPLVCSHIVIKLHKEKERKNASATILWYFPLIPTTSCSAMVLVVCVWVSVCVFACTYVHLHVCRVSLVSYVCGQNLNPCQDSNPVWKHSS